MRMKPAAICLLLLVGGCAPQFDLAGTMVQPNVGYTPLPIPSEERPSDRLGSASSRDLARWLVPTHANDIDTSSLTSTAPFGTIKIELVETPRRVTRDLCETAVNSFFGTDQTVRGKPTVSVFSGSRQILYRVADETGGCDHEPDAPFGFPALSAQAADGALRAYRDAVRAMRAVDRAADTSTEFLSPKRIVGVIPCPGETRCLSFTLTPSQAAPHGWGVTYRYGLNRWTRLEALSPAPAF